MWPDDENDFDEDAATFNEAITSELILLLIVFMTLAGGVWLWIPITLVIVMLIIAIGYSTYDKNAPPDNPNWRE